jgi:hypothetical protein
MPIQQITTGIIADNTVIAADVLDGTLTGAKLAANTLANSVFQTGSVENYSRATGLLSGMRNRIINGAMSFDQRNAGASVTPTVDPTYTLDRWQAWLSAASKYSVQQNAGAVTPPAGFTNYLGVTSLAATSLGAGDYYVLAQNIEGFNVADLNWGAANAKTVTLSFWVRSSLTGTFGGSLRNSAGNRSYPYTYTISAANTWEYKTITVAGDTTGTWATNNTTGLIVWISLGVGSNFSGTAGAWNANNNTSATGATSVVGTNGATFYITGVQLEVGSTATSFDYRPYGTELQLCQRYFIRYSGGPSLRGVINASYPTRMGMVLPVPMRVAPTATLVGTMSVFDGVDAKDVSSIQTDYSTNQVIEYNLLTGTTYATNGRACIQYQNGAFTLSAEL